MYLHSVIEGVRTLFHPFPRLFFSPKFEKAFFASFQPKNTLNPLIINS